MKKILSALLAVCMLFAVATTSGCTISAAKTIDEAIKKTEALDAIDVTFFMETSMNMGFSVTIPMTVNMKADNIKSSTPTMLASASTSMMGIELKSDVYMEEGMFYVSASGMNYKLKVEESDEDYDYVGNVNSIINDIPEDLLENVELVKNDDGSNTATISVDDARFKELFKDFICKSAQDTIIDDDDEENTDAVDDTENNFMDNILEKITVTDATVKVTVKNGYVLVYELSYSMKVSTIIGESTSSVKASVTYNNPGETVEITPPEGYKDFKDYSENIFDNLFG